MINKNIRYNRKDNFINHLRTFFRFEWNGYSGSISDNHFSIWHHKVAGVGIFYPILTGTISISEDKTKVSLKTKMNPVGLAIACIILMIWAIDIYYSIVIQQNNSLTFIWNRALIGALLLSLPTLALWLYYIQMKKELIEDISAICQNSLK